MAKNSDDIDRADAITWIVTLAISAALVVWIVWPIISFL